MIIGLLISGAGFAISLYIYRKQHAKKPLMCPRKAPCETVLNSPQSTIFGVSNAILGMVYYAIIFLLLLHGFMAGRVSLNLQAFLILFTAGGFFFSLYLIWLQRFVIKQWCVWCLGSGMTATLLFITILLLFH